MYSQRFAKSLEAKERYAQRWGYSWYHFDEASLDCSDLRPFRWRGDYRYCKLDALKVVWQKVSKTMGRGQRHYLFWHDVDTHIIRPDKPLDSFLVAAGHAPVVFTDNALSLNNGVFFLEMSNAGKHFLKHWRKTCKKGQWPWADNGCMYEAMLTYILADRYDGHCRQYMEATFDESRPEPPTGTSLMRCFNKNMANLGHGCCGADRNLPEFGFLTGPEDSFNHHPCHELERNRDFAAEGLDVIRKHCFIDGMFMVHTKNVTYVDELLLLADGASAAAGAGAGARGGEL